LFKGKFDHVQYAGGVLQRVKGWNVQTVQEPLHGPDPRQELEDAIIAIYDASFFLKIRLNLLNIPYYPNGILHLIFNRFDRYRYFFGKIVVKIILKCQNNSNKAVSLQDYFRIIKNTYFLPQ
jgi:hypothetical protein